MYVSDMDPTKNVYMWIIHQGVCKRHGPTKNVYMWMIHQDVYKRHGPHQKRIYVDDTSKCM